MRIPAGMISDKEVRRRRYDAGGYGYFIRDDARNQVEGMTPDACPVRTMIERATKEPVRVMPVRQAL